MLAWKKCVFVGLVMLVAASAPGQEARRSARSISVFTAPQESARNWCWAATGEMTMELIWETTPAMRANAGRRSRCWA